MTSEPGGFTGDGFVEHLARLRQIRATHPMLARHDATGPLFAAAVRLGCELCGFERGVVVGLRDDRIDASVLAPLPDDEASDRLRRQLLAGSLEITHGSLEWSLLRPEHAQAAGPSLLADALGLAACVVSPITASDTVIGLLVLDRTRPLEPLDVDAVDAFSWVLGSAAERVATRMRLTGLGEEFRYLFASANALLRESLDAPPDLPVGPRLGSAFPPAHAVAPVRSEGRLREILTAREVEIARQVALGRSNREIGERLHLSPETVKAHVAKILRKLAVGNRVELSSKVLALTQQPPDAS